MSRRSRIAPARTNAGAETTSPVGRTKPSHSRCARISGSTLAMGLVRLGPEVDEADGLDTLSAHLVELADALRLTLEIAVKLLEARTPRAHVGFELALLFITKVESQLLEVALVLGEPLSNTFALPL